MFHTIIKEMKEIFTDKKIWIGILTVLIIFIIGTSYNVQKSEKSSTDLLKLGVINKDKSDYSMLLLSYFNNSETFSSFITVVNGEEEDIKNDFQLEKLDVYLEIPEDFANNMIKLKHSPINVTVNISDTTKAILFQNVLASYEKYIASVEVNAVGLYEIMTNQGMDPELIHDSNRNLSVDLIFTALGKEKFFDFQPISQFPSTTLLNYYMASILVMSALYFGLYIGYRILREKEQGTFLRIRTTKTSLFQYLIAKLIVVVSLLTTALSVIILMNRVSITIEIIMLCLSITMFSVSQALFLCSILHTTQSFILTGNLIIFYFTLVGGGIIPVQFLPQNILLLSKGTPFYYILKGILSINNGPFHKTGDLVLGLTIGSVILILISVLLFYRKNR